MANINWDYNDIVVSSISYQTYIFIFLYVIFQTQPETTIVVSDTT